MGVVDSLVHKRAHSARISMNETRVVVVGGVCFRVRVALAFMHKHRFHMLLHNIQTDYTRTPSQLVMYGTRTLAGWVAGNPNHARTLATRQHETVDDTEKK